MAVDSFLAFKKLMVKRNQELNRQAMEMFNKQSQPADSTPTATGIGKGADGAAATDASDKTKSGPPLTEEEKKQQDELREVMRVAHSLERAEEEEMMKRALEESEKLKSEE